MTLGYRLSPQQKHLWLVGGNNPAQYHAYGIVEMNERLDRNSFRMALDWLSEWYEVVGTTYHQPQGMTLPLQVPDHAPPPAMVELKEMDPTQQVGQLAAMLDLTKGPVLVAGVCDYPKGVRVLLVVPSMNCDTRGMANLLKILINAYQCFERGDRPSEPLTLVEEDGDASEEGPLQYVVIADWQNDLLSSQEASAGKAYWERQPVEMGTVSPLPFLQSNPELDPALITLERPLKVELQASLHSLVNQTGIDLDLVGLGAWMLLLQSLGGQTIVGSCYAGRTDDELADAPGLIARFPPLAFPATARDFRQLLFTLRDQYQQGAQWLESFSWAESPSVHFPAAAYECRAWPHSEGYRILDLGARTERYFLKLDMVVRDTELSLVLGFEASLFNLADAHLLLDCLLTLLEAAVVQPDHSLSSLPLLNECERERQLTVFNKPTHEVFSPQLLHHLFESTARRSPEQIALVLGEGRLSYDRFDARANQLAHLLRTQGVGPDTPVAVYLNQGIDLGVALMGVLKSGACYVPFDPKYPIQRLRFMLGDCGAPLLVSTSDLALDWAGLVPALLLDACRPSLEKQPVTAPKIKTLPEHAAYLIYTSGSTGRPKGVLASHINATHSTLARPSIYKHAPEAFLLLSSFAFDSSVVGLFWTLSHGGTLHMLEGRHAGNSEAVAAEIERARISHILTVPTFYGEILNHVATLHSLQVVIVAGESCPRRLVERHFLLLPDTQMYNEYGPTEAAVWSSAYICRPGESGGVPIGHPIDRTRLHLCDPCLRLLPTGIAGELVISGQGLTRCYLGRPALTAEKFVPDPFAQELGARLYRTGDLARYRADGTLLFLGRVDHQVKIRGFRIEMGEIEHELEQHPHVTAAVVVLFQTDSEEPVLGAYVVPELGFGLPSHELRTALGKHLPDHMIPSHFMLVKSLPLSPNGKVDRKALPKFQVDTTKSAIYLAPRTPVEAVLATIWAKAFNRDPIGVNDNFFELGGHSLMATRVMIRLRETLEVDLPVRALFDAPTIAGLAQQVDRVVGKPKALPLEPVPRDQAMRLSFAQQRLWFLDQMEGPSATYNMPTVLELEGRLNVTALEQSVQMMTARHEVLRTRFQRLDGLPCQWIDAPTPFSLIVVAMSEPADQTLIEREAVLPFNLAQGPLLRVTLIRLAPGRHFLLVNMHHIISDGWSVSVFVREFTAIYAALCRDQVPKLEPLAVQYADYSHWQRGWLRDDILASQTAYWEKQLAGLPPLLELPTDFPRPAVQSYRGSFERMSLPPTLMLQIRSFCKERGVSLFMTLLASFKVLLMRYTGQGDIAVGSPIANRTHPLLEDLIGFFVNTLVLRNHVLPQARFHEFLASVRKTSLDAYTHQDVPFEHLVEHLHPERTLAHSPLFQVMFILQNAPGEALSLPGLKFSERDVRSTISKFDLTFSCFEANGTLEAVVEYSSDLFRTSTVMRMFAHFETLLAGVVDAPETSLLRLPMLSNKERQVVLEYWNDTHHKIGRDVCIHHLFEQQATQIPDSFALVLGDERVTYAELNQRANRLARFLSRQGVAVDQLVGLHFNRSIDMCVSLLAILKTGAAYLPLDPHYPAERLAMIIQESAVQIILTQSDIAEHVPDGPSCWCVDRLWAGLDTFVPSNPTPCLSGDNLVYVMYTSGSTGKPKGIALQHLVMTNLIQWSCRNTIERTGVLQFASINFDVSANEMFAAWHGAGTVFLIDEAMRYDADRLYAYLNTEPIGKLILPVVMMQQWASDFRQHGRYLKNVREITTTGEQLQITHPIVAFFEAHPHIRLHNHYGPAETHVVTAYSFVEEPKLWAFNPPIGKPIANTQAYILDPVLQPTPIGVPGELYLGGDCPARGYLNKGALTAERFLPDPFGRRAGGRLYKSGDRARYLPDGTIDFLGRADFMIKVRGFRVEPAEIESYLDRCQGVSRSLVVMRGDKTSDKQLVAYLVPLVGATPSASDLRDFLKQHLPDYMIPTAFVVLEAFPLNPNGKVDRHRLPMPQFTFKETLAPQTPTQHLLHQIWSKVLSRNDMGIDDDFFALGGHSLPATRVMVRIGEIFPHELTVRAIFETPTIRGLAERLDRLNTGDLPPIQPLLALPREAPPALSFAQRRLWFLDQLDGPNAAYNMPSPLALRGYIDVRLMEGSIAAIVERHDILRTTISLLNEEPVQLISDATGFSLDVVDFSGLQAHLRLAFATRCLHSDTLKPFHLDRGPLYRLKLFRLDSDDHLLLVNMHHIVSDGWSIDILVREIATFYRHPLMGDVSLPEPLKVQYADYAVWQQTQLQGEILDKRMLYWANKMKNAPPLLSIQTDRPRTPHASPMGGSPLSNGHPNWVNVFNPLAWTMARLRS